MNIYDYMKLHNIQNFSGMNWHSVRSIPENLIEELRSIYYQCGGTQFDYYRNNDGTFNARFHY